MSGSRAANIALTLNTQPAVSGLVAGRTEAAAFEKQLDKTGRSVDRMETEVEQLRRELTFLVAENKKAQTEIKRLGTEISRTEQETKRLDRTTRQATSGLRTAGRSVKRVGRSFGTASAGVASMSGSMGMLIPQLGTGAIVLGEAANAAEMFAGAGGAVLRVLGPVAIAVTAAGAAWYYFNSQLKEAEARQAEAAESAKKMQTITEKLTETERRAQLARGEITQAQFNELQAGKGAAELFSERISGLQAERAEARKSIEVAKERLALAEAEQAAAALAQQQTARLRSTPGKDDEQDVRSQKREAARNLEATTKAAEEQRTELERLSGQLGNLDDDISNANTSQEKYKSDLLDIANGAEGAAGATGRQADETDRLAEAQERANDAFTTRIAMASLNNDPGSLGVIGAGVDMRNPTKHQDDAKKEALEEIKEATVGTADALEAFAARVAALKIAQQAGESTPMAVSLAKTGLGGTVREIDALIEAEQENMQGRRQNRVSAASSIISGNPLGVIGMGGGPAGMAVAAGVQGLSALGEKGAEGVIEAIKDQTSALANGIKELPKLIALIPEMLGEMLPELIKAILMLPFQLVPALLRAVWELIKGIGQAIKDALGIGIGKEGRQERREERRGKRQNRREERRAGRSHSGMALSDREQVRILEQGETVTRRGDQLSQAAQMTRGSAGVGRGQTVIYNGPVFPEALSTFNTLQDTRYSPDHGWEERPIYSGGSR